MLTTIITTLVTWGAKYLGLKLIADAAYKQALDQAFRAGVASGIAQMGKKQEAVVLAQPPAKTPAQAIPELNDLYKAKP